jgi:predicted TIM-barrel fold metal-dependent hydrolase
MVSAIDMHVHLGPRWDDVRNVRATCEDLAAAAWEAEVSLSVASSSESLLSKTALGFPDDGEMERRLFAGNEVLLGHCRDRCDLRMAVVADPCLQASLRQVGEMLRDPSVVAVKLHPDRHRYRGGDHAEAVLRMLEETPGKAMLMHCTGTAFSDPAPVIECAVEHATVPVILAHLGRTSPPELVIELIRERRARNVYVDTSAMRDPVMVRRAIEAIGAGRILFGSDFPFYRPADIIALIRSSGAEEHDLQRILYGNAAELFGAA